MKNFSKEELKKQILKIELMDPEEVKLNPVNPRKITEKEFSELVKSVETFWQMLFLRPVILDEDGFALGGNHKTLAARKLKFKAIPVIKAINLSEQQRREFMIKDNTHAGEWDFDILANDWDSGLLNDWDFRVPEFKSPEKKNVSFEAREKFDIIIPAATELERQQTITRLKIAGFKDNEFNL